MFRRVGGACEGQKLKTIGIVGARARNSAKDFKACFEAFHEVYEKGDRIVSGGCPRGGDLFAESIAKKLGITITIHYPDWDGLGNSAGFARNTLIAEECDILIAVVVKHRKGGTEDTIRKVKKLKKEVVLVE